MSPIIRKCEEQGIDYYILHTGQHYSYEMDKIFFEQLKLPQAKYNLVPVRMSMKRHSGTDMLYPGKLSLFQHCGVTYLC